MREFTGYRIDDERPGELLRLTWKGPPPRRWTRWMPYLLVLAYIAVLLGFATWVFGPSLAKPLAEGGTAWEELLPFGFLLLVGLAAGWNILGTVARACHARGYWSELTWDARASVFSAQYIGVPGMGNRSLQVELSEIERLHFDIGPETDQLITLQVEIHFRGLRESLDMQLDLEHLDRRAEALDLLLRVARIAGHVKYRILRVWPSIMSVETYDQYTEESCDEEFEDDYEAEEEADEEADEELASNDNLTPEDQRSIRNASARPESRDEGRAADEGSTARASMAPIGVLLPIPADRSYANYQVSTTSSAAQTPKVDVSRFQAAGWPDRFRSTHLRQWQPGEVVALERPGASLGGLVVKAIFLGVFSTMIAIAGLFWLIQLAMRPEEVSRAWTALVIFCVSTLAGLVYFWPSLRSRAVRFDWRRGEFYWREGRRNEVWSIGDIEALELRPALVMPTAMAGTGTAAGGNAGRAVLLARLADGLRPIVETEALQPNYDEALRQLLPFTTDLAAELSVPWYVMRDSRATGGVGWSRGKVVIACACLVLVLIGAGVRGVSFAAVRQREQYAREQLVAAGAEVVYLEKRDVEGGQSLERVWRVTFPDGVDDARLIALIPHLARLARLDLDLAGAAITDAGVFQLSELREAVAIDLRDTVASDAGLDKFYYLNDVEYINLARTRISDMSVGMCVMNDSLRVLVLDETRVTDDCLRNNLRVARRLRHLSVKGTRVTTAGQRDLEQSVPEVRIVGANP